MEEEKTETATKIEDEDEDEGEDEDYIGRWVVHELVPEDVFSKLGVIRQCFKLQASENEEEFTRGDYYLKYDIREEVSATLAFLAEKTHQIKTKEDLETWQKTFADFDMDEEFADIAYVMRIYRKKDRVFVFFKPPRKADYLSDYDEDAEGASGDNDDDVEEEDEKMDSS
jgi:hypothetical protein